MIAVGILASLGLTAFYYLVLWLLTQDADYPIRQFLALQPWMSLLIVGFGIQWAIFARLRQGKMMIGGNSVVSGTSMVACCAHHAVEALPFLGLAGAAVFLVNYQKELLVFGVLSNLAGIGYMAWRLKPQPAASLVLEPKIVNLGQVEVSVTPQAITAGKTVVFKLVFTTHSVDLNYDIAKAVNLKDDHGNNYQVVSWSGGRGGHHLQGELVFEPLKPGAKQLSLSFENINGGGGELLWQL